MLRLRRIQGVGLSVKPHGGSNATGAQCRKIIEMVGHKNFGIWYDPGNIFFYSDGKVDPVDDVPGGRPDRGHEHQGFQAPKEVMVTPGTGKVNFREVLARARKGGFTRGPLVVECLDRAATRRRSPPKRAKRGGCWKN